MLGRVVRFFYAVVRGGFVRKGCVPTRVTLHFLFLLFVVDKVAMDDANYDIDVSILEQAINAMPDFFPFEEKTSPMTEPQRKLFKAQSMVTKYLTIAAPVPPELLRLVVEFSLSCQMANPPPEEVKAPQFLGVSGGVATKCRRTDGKKWRCHNDAAPNKKYCLMHMHRGKERRRKIALQKQARALAAIAAVSERSDVVRTVSPPAVNVAMPIIHMESCGDSSMPCIDVNTPKYASLGYPQSLSLTYNAVDLFSKPSHSIETSPLSSDDGVLQSLLSPSRAFPSFLPVDMPLFSPLPPSDFFSQFESNMCPPVGLSAPLSPRNLDWECSFNDPFLCNY